MIWPQLRPHTAAAARVIASSSNKSAWTQGSGGTRGSIREVTIFRSVSSRTMSAADPLRSWRSADKSKCGDHGEVRSGGPKTRKNDARLAGKMQIRSKVGSRDREVVAAKSQRFGPQSRALTYQTDLLGEKRGADVTSSPRAVTYGQVTR